MKNGKGIKNTTKTITYSTKPLRQLWESTSYIFKGLCYYYSLLIDFLFGNITNIIMYNLLKVTIVFLTVVSFFTTFSGLNDNFFDTWTALFVTIGVQGTLLALSLYVPVYQSAIATKRKQHGNRFRDNIKKYLIWIPLLCCLFVSSFFSYVALSEKVYSKIEGINNEYEVKSLFNDIFKTVEGETYTQIQYVENNITNVINHLKENCNKIMQDNNVTANDISTTEKQINELKDRLDRDKVRYERALENYQRYQEAVATTVDEAKRNINREKAEEELKYIDSYESDQYTYESLLQARANNKVSQGDISALNATVQDILTTLEQIQKYNVYGIKLPFTDLDVEIQKLAEKLEAINALDIKIDYLLETIKYKQDLELFKDKLSTSRQSILESSSLEDMKGLIYTAPFNKYILKPSNMNQNTDIKPIDTFKMLESIYNFERLTSDGVNQIEKSIGYLTDNSFPLLAYLALSMAFFVDTLILVQGFSVTKSLSKSAEMEDVDKQELIHWMLRKQYSETNPDTGKVVRMKMIDKFLSYCVPNENCTKIYIKVDEIRTNPQISMLVNLLNQLDYLIVNEDEKLILDPDLMVLYLQRSSLMVDTDYFYLGDSQPTEKVESEQNENETRRNPN